MGKRGGQDRREASPNCFHDLLCVVTKRRNVDKVHLPIQSLKQMAFGDKSDRFSDAPPTHLCVHSALLPPREPSWHPVESGRRPVFVPQAQSM